MKSIKRERKLEKLKKLIANLSVQLCEGLRSVREKHRNCDPRITTRIV